LLISVFADGAEATEPEPAEVVVIATQHFITDMPDGYTPAHLRLLLKKVEPDILAVEAPANVPDPWAHAPMDLWRVTKPWAEANSAEMAPVGWYERHYRARLNRMFQIFRARGQTAAYQTIEQKFQLESARHPPTCEYLNGEAAHRLWREYHTGLHRLYGKDTPWEEWNAKIAANIGKVCRKHEGRRIAVLFGSAHCYYIIDALATVEGVQVIPVERFFPLSLDEIDAQTVPKDYVNALRPLNFPNYGGLSAPALQRLETFLRKVEGFPELQGDYHLFRGKLLLHRLKPQEALLEFEKVAALDADVLSASDGHTRLREAGLVFTAVAKDQAGKHLEARQDLLSVIKTEGISPRIRQWAEQILESILAEPQRPEAQPAR